MECPGVYAMSGRLALGHVRGVYVLLAVLGGAAGTGSAALEGAALVFTHTAPYARVLAGLKGPLQAGVHNRAPAADALGFLDLQEGRACVSNGEEQFRVLVEARCAVTPIHADQLLHFWEVPL